MGRKRKVITEADGTPVEIEDGDDDTAEQVAAVFSDPPAAPDASAVYGEAPPVEVIWTELGETDGVFSEHGQHKAGDKVLTRHSVTLIANGYAEKK